MQIETLSYRLVPVRMATIKKTRDNKCWRGCGEKWTSRTVGRIINWGSHYGRLHVKELSAPHVHCSIIYMSQNMETASVPIRKTKAVVFGHREYPILKITCTCIKLKSRMICNQVVTTVVSAWWDVCFLFSFFCVTQCRRCDVYHSGYKKCHLSFYFPKSKLNCSWIPSS